MTSDVHTYMEKRQDPILAIYYDFVAKSPAAKIYIL